MHYDHPKFVPSPSESHLSKSMTDVIKLEIDFYASKKKKSSSVSAQKRYYSIYIQGVFSAKVASQAATGIIVSFGLGQMNDADNHLVQFYHKKFFLSSIPSSSSPIVIYILGRHQISCHNQISNVLCNHQGSGSIFSIKIYLSANCNSDQSQIMQYQTTVPTKQFDITKIPSTYAVEMKNRFELLDIAKKRLNVLWQEIQSTIIETTGEHIL